MRYSYETFRAYLWLSCFGYARYIRGVVDHLSATLHLYILLVCPRYCICIFFEKICKIAGIKYMTDLLENDCANMFWLLLLVWVFFKILVDVVDHHMSVILHQYYLVYSFLLKKITKFELNLLGCIELLAFILKSFRFKFIMNFFLCF